MSTRIQKRRGTAAAWTSANPVLAAGEEGWETDTHKGKTGDGSTAWTSLAYDVVPDVLGTFAALAAAPSPSINYLAAHALSNTNWDTFVQLANAFYGGYSQSSGAQNDKRVDAFYVSLAGTYTLALLHLQSDVRGKYTVEFSSNGGGSWVTPTSLGGSVNTIDGYFASVQGQRSEITGLVFTAGAWQMRLTMATKNASAGAYYGSTSAAFFEKTA